ncbi:MAG: deoxyribose-phosphate aldolase [Carboxylicivirga sp.]|jgi:deoxyribose-phosphate aldolase|nr:deoxyribose-phosphate aldolase [Carboxylicivirga sp.]
MKRTLKEIARYIDLSCVQANNTIEEIKEAAALAIKYNCICTFALPAHTPILVEALKGYPDIRVGGVVGFPGGGTMSEVKEIEASKLVEMGVDEIDMVINIGHLKAGNEEAVKADIEKVIKGAKGLPVKVILECHHLSNEEIVKACEICVGCGVAFVKTGTGWAPTGATLENVDLMKKTVGDRCEVKAAGGVRDLETIEKMLDLGVTRFGIGVRTAKAIFENTGLNENDY